jgi:2-polyprenyl-6-hydroxyphenyl methylase/3-demethylubiquinone-9 3-methyltransferase
MTPRADVAARLSGLLGAQVPGRVLTDREAAYLADNLECLGDVRLIWKAMDAAREAEGAGFGCGAEQAELGRFYAGPVWVLNGLFTETDPVSQAHREAIAAVAGAERPRLVADYGGGFGALARRLATVLPGTEIRVIEPWPHPLALHLAERHPNLCYAQTLPEDADMVVAQDVLEHVVDPLADFASLLDATRSGGAVITANCFQPVIRYHYPGALHLHFSFTLIARRLGCRLEGPVPGAPHAQIFRKTNARPDWRAARRLERLSRAAYPCLLRVRNAKLRLLGSGETPA